MLGAPALRIQRRVIQKKLRSPHDPGLDLFHRFAQGGITKVALGDLKEAGAWPAGLEKFEVCEGGDALVEAVGEEDG